MSLKLSAILICLNYFARFEAKILLLPREIENGVEQNAVQSNDKGRINLSMPGNEKRTTKKFVIIYSFENLL